MNGRCAFTFLLPLFAGSLVYGSQASQATGSKTQPAAASAVDRLKSPDANVRAKAAREIGNAKDASAIPALATLLADPSAKVRHEVVFVLSQMREPSSLQALIKATRDADPGVRALAVQAIVGYYTGKTPGSGFTAFVTNQVRRAKVHFVGDDTRIDPGVTVDSNGVQALIAAMKDVRSIKAARESAKGLGALVAGAAVPSLVESAHSRDERLALEALNALDKIEDRSAGPKLLDLLDSPDKEIKRKASVTLGILRTDDALPKLQAIFQNDPDKINREKALEGLADLGKPVSVPLFTKALWNDDKALRTSAAEGLARASDNKTLGELEKALGSEKDAGVKLAEQFALTALGKDDHLSELVHGLASKFRGSVAQTYLKELSRDKKFLPKLYAYLTDADPAVRKRLCTVLMFTGDQSSLAPLVETSHDSNADVAAEALRALRALRIRTAPHASDLKFQISDLRFQARSRGLPGSSWHS